MATQMTFNPTRTTAQALEYAYDILNHTLFANSLPECYITWTHQPRVLGHCVPDRYEHRENPNDKITEIALNPDLFASETLQDILSTLAHEQAHVWQNTHGSPSRGGYHNREWTNQMLTIGLQPIRADGSPGLTGQAMDHTIIPNGPFDHISKELIARGWTLMWQTALEWRSPQEPADPTKPGAPEGGNGKRKPKPNPSKTKYTCPNCHQNAWAKESALLTCGYCKEEMIAAPK